MKKDISQYMLDFLLIHLQKNKNEFLLLDFISSVQYNKDLAPFLKRNWFKLRTQIFVLKIFVCHFICY